MPDGVIIMTCSQLGVEVEDQWISYSTKGDDRLSIIIGQRYCLGYFPTVDLKWQFVSGVKRKSTDEMPINKYDCQPETYAYYCRTFEEMDTYFDEISVACSRELSRTQKSGFRRHSNEVFEKLIHNELFRDEFLKNISDNLVSSTGLVWKMGCNWGQNKPDYNDLVKMHKIVICVEDRTYSIEIWF
jgi:hypothetical protein